MGVSTEIDNVDMSSFIISTFMKTSQNRNDMLRQYVDWEYLYV